MGSKWLRIVACFLALAALAGAAWPSSASAAAAAVKAPKAPNDTLWANQWGMRRIGIPAAWARSEGKGITVAVIDTGVDGHHEDLIGQMSKYKYDAVTGKLVDGDGFGHGTLAAGIIAARTNNKKGVAGVAPLAKIMPVRAFKLFSEEKGASSANVAKAINWATDHGANVINMSLGGAIATPDEILAVLRATAMGVLVVASAGNSAEPVCAFPAAIPGALCVGATDKLDRPTSFTNYGVRLDLVAPGENIWSTGYIASIDGHSTVGAFPSDQYHHYQAVPGTSFSAPFVSGVGALLMSMGASNITAQLILRLSAKDLGLPGYDLTYGFGRLDAKRAVDMCAQIC